MDALEVIVEYWLTWTCGVIALALAALWRWAKKRFKQQQTENEALKAGVQALLHDRIWQAHQYYHNQKWCSLDDKRNIEILYKPYAKLGGNGTGKEAFEEIFALPSQPPEE